MDASKGFTGAGREIGRSDVCRAGSVLLESIIRDAGNTRSFLFRDPVTVIQCSSSAMVEPAMAQVDDAVSRGMYAAGFLSYEAGAAWTPRREPVISGTYPLLWFGLYERVERFECPLILPAPDYPREPITPVPDLTPGQYRDRVRAVLDYIREGETYQVNFTARTSFQWRHGAWQLYLRLRRSQRVPYSAYLNCGNFSLVSLSPELFLQRTGNTLQARPMKGTAPRGKDPSTDRGIASWLRSDPKNMAENLMIVDLMRNDMGRLAEKGTVQVLDPFRIEPYTTIFQMTSGVRCTLKKGTSLGDIFRATFPPGSVTGAPKVRTMEIISEIEDTPRRVYTGAIGYIGPADDMSMNVAIRTIHVSPSGRCEMGVGSGIVADSDPVEEWEETNLKTRFLNVAPAGRVDLFETTVLRGDGSLRWMEDHLDRMENSARMLGYPFDRDQILKTVGEQLGDRARGPAIARIALTLTGDVILELFPLKRLASRPLRAELSPSRTDPYDPLLRHKTTRRDLYDLELARVRRKGCVEAFFINHEGYLTEGAFTNIFVLDNSGWKTPEIRCGLLPGLWRRKFIESTQAVQTCLTPGDLQTATRVVIGNSVRGAMDVDEILDAQGAVIYKAPGLSKRRPNASPPEYSGNHLL